MSLANIQGKLSRTEMKNITAGSGDGYSCVCCTGGHFAGMASCSTCDSYCTSNNWGGMNTCS